MRSVWEVIKGPVITERALTLKDATAETKQLLTFRVATNANKREIRAAVEQIFKVKVDSVRVTNYRGKVVRRGRTFGRKPDWKKAFVTLKAGETPVEYAEVI